MLSDSASIEFFGNGMAIGFGLVAVLFVSETIRAAKASLEESASFAGVTSNCLLVILTSALPLVLSNLENWLAICSTVFALGGVLACFYYYFQLTRNFVVIRFKGITFSLIGISLIGVLMIGANIWIQSLLIYKICVSILLMVSIARLFLFNVFLHGPNKFSS